MEIDLQMLAMIFFINMAYVTLNTIRFLLTIKELCMRKNSVSIG